MYSKWIPIGIILCTLSCNKEAERLTRVDAEFTKRFELSGGGNTGADGTYSVYLPDGRTVWIFGDSFLGTVTPELTREKTNPMYIRNCFMVDDGDSLITLHQGEPSEFKSMIIPPIITDSNFEINERQHWYWPGDGWVDDNQLKVFVSEFFQSEPGMWGFKFKRTAIITYSLPEIEQVSLDTIPYSNVLGIHYGHAVCKTEEFVYVYGLHDGRPHAARIDGNGSWQFYSGSKWSDEAKDSKPMSDISGSEQFSVFEHEGDFIMIMQEGSLSRKIFSYVAKTPYGPWVNRQLIYETPLPYDNDQLFTYNALAHPQFTQNDELLISYNTNSMQLEDHFKNAGIYRPRFIRVPFEMIIKQ
ncbi:MAG: hypothetical protein DRI71_11070 [Bacteroidetes bacterium]|nr:MAG: hypothetical protein DRI71_11070 [Bacteroidota bacterium]